MKFQKNVTMKEKVVYLFFHVIYPPIAMLTFLFGFYLLYKGQGASVFQVGCGLVLGVYFILPFIKDITVNETKPSNRGNDSGDGGGAFGGDGGGCGGGGGGGGDGGC